MATPPAPEPAATAVAPTAPAPVIDFTAQPYFYPNPDGSFGGVGSTKPETIPGTPEFEVTKAEQLRTANQYVFDSALNYKAYTQFESSENLAVFGTKRAPSKSEDREAAAWKLIKHDRPASEHNAGVVYDRLYKFANQKKQIDVLNGVAFPQVFGMDDKELVEFVTNPENNIPATVAAEVIREADDTTYFKERRRFGVDMKGKIQRRLLDLDDRYKAGELVAQGGKPYFDGLTQQAKIAAWKNYAYYKDSQRNVNFANEAVTAGLNFIEDGITAIKGSVDALLPTAPDEYLAPAYRQDAAKRAKAEEIVKRSTVILQPVIDRIRIAQSKGNSRELLGILDHYTDFDSPDNQEVIKALTEMAALRADGAFAPGKHGEKLASFGAGVIESVPTFKNFISDSLDPGSILFLNEKHMNSDLAGPAAVVMTVIDKFRNNTKYWNDASDEDVLAAINQYSENWQNVNTNTGNAVASAYDAIGLKSAAYAARTAYGDVRLKEAATATMDPITLGLGGATIIGRIAGRGTMNAAKFAELSARGKAISAEGEAIAAEIRTAGGIEKGALTGSVVEGMERVYINEIITKFKNATGRTLSEGEALAVLLSEKADDIINTGAKGTNEAADMRSRINYHLAAPEFADLAKRVKDFQAKAAAHADELAGVEKTTRPVSGRVIQASGWGVEVFGKGVSGMGKFLGGGQAERAIGKKGIYWLLNNQPVPWVQGAIGGVGGYFVTDGDTWTGNALGGAIGVFSAGYLLRPQAMVSAGTNMQTYGKVVNRLGKVAVSGEYVATTPLNGVMNGIRSEIGKTPVTVENAGKIAALNDEFRMTKWMVDSGWEDAMRGGFHVVVDDVIHGGTMGAAFAWANDRSTAGQGFGVGAASGTSIRALARVSEMLIKPTSDEIRSKQIWADIIGIDKGLDAHQSTRLRQWLGEAKSWDDQVSRADSYRRAYMATNGRIQLTNPAEMAAMSLTTHLAPEQVAKIREEANTIHKDDPTAAALYAQQKLAEMDSRKQSQINLDALTRDLSDSSRRLDSINGEIAKTQEKINTEMSNLKANGLTESKRLIQLQHHLETQQTALKVTTAENMQLTAEHAEAGRQVENPLTFRKFEERTNINGTGTIRQVKEGVFIDQGPNSHTIYFDVTKGDPFTMFHETWEALLYDDAVRPMSNEMTATLWGGEGKGQRISDQARDVFFNTYANNLTASEKAAFNAQLAAAKKHFTDTGSTAMLDRFTRETLAWWMATIDSQARPAGYVGSKDTPSKNVGVRGAGIIDSIARLTRGDRRILDILNNDNVRAELNMLLDPEVGIIPRRFAANAVQNLQSSGMRFVRQSDGTVRGFWTNNRNEVVRDPVVVKLYESVLRMTSGGKGSPRLADLSVTQLTHQQQAQLFVASGLSWLVDPNTNTPIPGINQPGTAAQNTPPPAPVPVAGSTGTPTPVGGPAPTPVIPTHNGQPIPAPGSGNAAPGTPAPATPAPAGGPAGPPTAPTHNGQPVPPPNTAPTRGAQPPPAPTPKPASPTAAPAAQVPTQKPPVNPSTMPDVRQVTSAHADMIVRVLQGVSESERGFRWSVDSGAKGKPTIMWGKPSAAEMKAIESLRGSLPDTIVDNLLHTFNAINAGVERPVFQARYLRVDSHRTSPTTEVRVKVGPENQFVTDETFVPLHAETTIQYVSPEGTISASEYAKLNNVDRAKYTPTNSYTVKVFNLGKFNQNLSTARSEGLRIYDKDGNVTGYVKDLAGNEITAKRFNELFKDDTEFHTLANQWMQRYLEGGPIDPTSVEIPGGKITEPSAAMLGNGDLVLGEARLTALRATFGFTVRKGRVVVNPTNFTNEVVRGMNFPIHSLNLSTLGPMLDTGARSMMAQPVVTRGQFNMSPGAWDKLSSERVGVMRGKGNLSNAWTHPELPNTHIHEYGGKVYEIFIEGQEVSNTARSFDEAVAQSNSIRLQAESELDASRFADKIFQREAKERADAEAKISKANDKEKAKIAEEAEKRRVASEAFLLKEVNKKHKEWVDRTQALAIEEARIAKEIADAKAKSEAEHNAAVERTRQTLDTIQAERARINRQLKEDIIQRSAEKAAAEAKNNASAERANIDRTAAVDRDAARTAAELRADIERRSADKAAKEAQRAADQAAKDAAEKARIASEDANALADALNSNAPELDLASVINASLRVDAKGLGTIAVNKPLVVRRVGGGKPFVPRGARTGTQAGSAVDATAGNTRAAGILGSPEVAAQVPTVNKYFDRHMGLALEVERAINSVWKTDLGNQLVAYYNGLNNKGKAVYTYHLYGIDGTELYRTQDSRAAYNALQMNEERIRNPMKNVPNAVSREEVTAELYRSTSGKSVINQFSTSVEREKMERAAKQYK